ncbi:EscU/YscU/HrcU family type III secretion system export apparatus switch protein [Alteromonadaceae bacterium BrNp21-10]|nr:EscU/YscU/HrcU family type III secretion system export apparatus switch protein [Alteromonadaceae bacterium BrNp21-10]
MKKPTASKKAIGLKYSVGSAPEVVAKGFDSLAEQIIAIAKEHGVLIHEDDYLSDFLSRLDLGQQIPEELYHVIAELIAFSYVLQGKFPENWQSPSGGVNSQA